MIMAIIQQNSELSDRFYIFPVDDAEIRREHKLDCAAARARGSNCRACSALTKKGKSCPFYADRCRAGVWFCHLHDPQGTYQQQWHGNGHRKPAAPHTHHHTAHYWRKMQQRADPDANTSSTIAAAIPSLTHRRIRLWTDGACHGAPGPAGIGCVLRTPEGASIDRLYRYIGLSTCNIAEYKALVQGLELCLDYGAREVEALTDSNIVANRVSGKWEKPPMEHLRPYLAKVRLLAARLDRFAIYWIPREQNIVADALATLGAGLADRADKRLMAKLSHEELTELVRGPGLGTLFAAAGA